jgi:CheY-like chemotaxis protein
MERRDEPSVHTYSNAPSARKSVLVIDDNDDLLTLLRTILEIDDYQIFTAQSGKEALKVLLNINDPDLIFLDVQMGDMSGPDFLLMLEEKRPELVKAVPVVFLTGMDKVPKSKAVGFIRKPIGSIDSFLKDTHRFIEAGYRTLSLWPLE